MSVSTKSISRRSFAALAGATIAAGALAKAGTTAGVARADAPSGTLVAGTYTATAAGASGDVSVSVELSDSEIVSIEIGENNETDYLMRAVSETIPARIIEAQSLAVDAVTGATLASRGVIDAVSACLEQAGADLEAWSQASPTVATDEALEADVVVVGSGLAGIMAAQRLMELGVENVVVLEKQGMPGGSAVYSAGQMYGAIEEEKLDYARETFLERTLTFPTSDETADYPSPEKVDVLINEGHRTFEYFQSLGFELAYTDMTFLDTPADTRVILNNPAATEAGITSQGEMLWWTLCQRFESFGGKIMLETSAEEILLDDAGAVRGVAATTRTGTLTVSSPYVVVCTGSAGRGPDVLAKYCPSLADGEVRVLTMGSDGSGIEMMASVGAAISKAWAPATAGVFSVDPTSQWTNASRNVSVASTSELYVDAEGQRLCAEFTQGSNVYYYSKVGAEDCVYVLLDSALAGQLEKAEKLEQGLADFPDRVFRSDTLEGLLEAAGLPVEATLATIGTYNRYCASGVDEAFGKDPEDLVPLETAPFWCVRYSVTGKDVCGGVQTDVESRVLDESGDVIRGLYACGFAGNRDYYGTEQVGSVGLQVCVTAGRLAAESIAAQILA